MNAVEVLFMLFAAHALADYPLQGDFLARGKQGLIPGAPRLTLLSMHGLIHGGLVALVTGLWWLGLLETIAHCVIDEVKTRGAISFNADQAAHLGCKVAWAVTYAAVS